ncbi:hypothetical protein [Bosea sp. BK604]|uniref:hypothetical protein n=1 Tax=Bosea sp. BK604 TaxID=2512180 RepID=UPI00104BB598|nr:hypothetical protein [Bosea sp. BK604]TCR66605.1 hypothetical protein EV560_104486 [Bosea sp. BK604]
MSKHISWIVALSIAAAVAGCATTPVVNTTTVIVAGVGPVEIESLSVRVVSVDRPSRSVIVEQRGRRWLVDVPPLFGDLSNVRVGDTVEIRRIEGAVLEVRRSRRGAKPGITYTEAVSGPQFQNLPDKYVVRALTLTARFERFDPATNVVSYVGPLGPRTLNVADPAIRAELQTMRRGDMVDLTFAEAFHIILN